ncbi:nitric oxide reductase transcriptional regulator NorR [Verticiella sediminum]|uniref:Nitric oxide reductase transcriptional regulator NorR n=1 Tax=Verticiella sediminum TaxID=1247510 RepID=A0A556A6M6_9BURK|nr:nitric oxide reductase transcriptional regulator NorR [Verticiella sediminum]TSH88514.1 nitric oxide reductase transcriptional regulator NorR [Verticiella sediminum]
MTRSAQLLDAIVPLIADLAQELPAELRYQRLLDAVRSLLPCDAVALLQLDGDALVPLAVQGLSPDTLGRRFAVAEQPRLKALLEAPRAMRFAPGCELPDPYDGLVESEEGTLEVHDCMGSALRVQDHTWGVLTLDALQAGRFSPADLRVLDAFGSLAAATVAAGSRLHQLAQGIEDERERAEAFRLAASPARHTLVGQSPVFRQMRAEIELVAPSDLTVLVTGETGVGKELTARELHQLSSRAGKPLVSVNCAALPENLVESELFGHVRGAFSGALAERPGRFEVANGGTLFLDEIGELPLVAQAKLLRVLQDGQLQRIGSDREHRVDVRLVAATNRDLADEVRAGRFRADLYHRLSVYPLRVPPLRERGRDVLLLAGAFLEENRRRVGARSLRLSADAQAALLAHPWPGNVRELEYLIARAALKAAGRSDPASNRGTARPRIVTLDLHDLGLEDARAAAASAAGEQPAAQADTAAAPATLREAIDAYQKRLIAQALAAHDGNVAAAARALGLDRANLARLMKRLGCSDTGGGARHSVP